MAISALKFRRKPDKIPIPKSLQQTIPVDFIYPDGIAQRGKKYSQTFRLTDVNYSDAPDDVQQTIFAHYSDLINALDPRATSQITLICYKNENNAGAKELLMQDSSDGCNGLRHEFNRLIGNKLEQSSGYIADKYLTISIEQETYEEAKQYFQDVAMDLNGRLVPIGSGCRSMNASERIRLLHSIYRRNESRIRFNYRETLRKGESFRDYVCPDAAEFANDHFRLGKTFGQCMYLKDIATFLSDEFLRTICNSRKDLIISISLTPVPPDAALKLVQGKIDSTEMTIAKWSGRQVKNNNFAGEPPHHLTLQREESTEFFNDLQRRDQRMLSSTVLVTHFADDEKQLASDSNLLIRAAAGKSCQLAVLNYQQWDGLMTTLPFGINAMHIERTLTTEGVAGLMPFAAQELNEPGGLYFGINRNSRNVIRISREALVNGNAIFTGKSGAGKSLLSKLEQLQLILNPNIPCDIIVLDPQNEYTPIVTACHGTVVHMSPNSDTFINAMEISKGYAGEKGNPIATKAEFILCLCEQIIGTERLTGGERSIIDRCVRLCLKNQKAESAPTLKEFQQLLREQPEKEARDIALALELYVDGSLSMFAQPTNVDVSNRLISFETSELGQQLQPVGMLTVIDHIRNRAAENKRRGRKTIIYVDELHRMFRLQLTREAFERFWREVRKYDAYITGMTQEIGELLNNAEGKTILNNSELVVLLAQAEENARQLAELYHLSEIQTKYFSESKRGCGIIKCGSKIVPFDNEMDEINHSDSELAELLRTSKKEEES